MAVYSILANPYTSHLPTYPDLGKSDRIYQLINKVPTHIPATYPDLGESDRIYQFINKVPGVENHILVN